MKKILETKAEFSTEDDALIDAKHFLEQNYPDVDRYHFQITVKEEKWNNQERHQTGNLS